MTRRTRDQGRDESKPGRRLPNYSPDRRPQLVRDRIMVCDAVLDLQDARRRHVGVMFPDGN
jgi:hypothetical protein